MRRMSERLERYDVRFVFIADKKRPLEEGKQQPLIFFVCWAGISPSRAPVDTHTTRGGDAGRVEGLYTGLRTRHGATFMWSSG